MDSCHWRQINSISLKTVTITSAYFKERQYPWKYLKKLRTLEKIVKH